MNDVVFVMTNSRFNKKDVRKNDFNIDNLAFVDDWVMEENEVKFGVGCFK